MTSAQRDRLGQGAVEEGAEVGDGSRAATEVACGHIRTSRSAGGGAGAGPAPEHMPGAARALVGDPRALVDEPGALVGDPGALVDEVRRVVAAREPIDEREAGSRLRILSELDRLERPLDRAADPVHVTGSAVVAGTRGTVLHRHKRLGRWMQPGGHLDAGELPASAARREALEETGLDVRHVRGGPLLVHVDVHDAADAHVHLDLRYLLLAGGADPAPAPGESPAVAWYSWDDALDLADASLRGALRSAMAALQVVDDPAACR